MNLSPLLNASPKDSFGEPMYLSFVDMDAFPEATPSVQRHDRDALTKVIFKFNGYSFNE